MTFTAHCRLPAVLLLLCWGLLCVGRERPEGSALPDGATLILQLDQDVRADSLKAGDEVRATVVAPMMSHGAIAVPARAGVTAVVVSAEPLTFEHPSRLVLLFRRASWSNAARSLNAYVTRQVVLKRNYSLESRTFCPPAEAYTSPQARQALNGAPPAAFDDSECRIPLGNLRENVHRMTFTSPAIFGVVLRKLRAPKHAIVLEAAKEHVFLHKGMLLEIRHSAE